MKTRFTLAALLVALLALAPASLAQNAKQRAASLLDHAERTVSGDTEAVARKGGPAVVQLPDQLNGFFSDPNCGLCGFGAQSEADNINLGAPLSVNDLTIWGAYFPNNTLPADDFTVIFHSDASGAPGAAFSTQANLTPACRQDTGVDLFGVDEYVYRLEFDAPVDLPAGVTHIEVYNGITAEPDDWIWETGSLDPEEGIVNSNFAEQVPGTTWLPETWEFAFALNAGTIYCTEGGDPEVDVDIGINTYTTEPMRGESVFFRGPVTNTGPATEFVYVYTEIDVPGLGTFKRNIGGKDLAPGETFKYKDFPKSKNYFPLTNDAPEGWYTITVFAASDRFGTVIYDQDSFDFYLGPMCYLDSGGCLSTSVPTTSSLEIAEPTAAPNPFRDQAEIRYALAEDTEVDLRVFDVTGREVAALVSGTQSAGTHAATLRAGDLPGGVYVWRLAIGGEVTTGRVTLAR